MSSLPLYERDHTYNCPICRPKAPSQYLGRYESYLSLIKSEISMLPLPYQSKLNLEQTIEDILYSIYSSKAPSEQVPISINDYRSQEKLLNLEQKYSSLLYDYEKERNYRLDLETELSSLQSRVIHLTQVSQDCSEKHVSALKVTDLNSEIEMLKRRLQDALQENHELRNQKKINDELKFNHRELQGEVDKKDKRISQVLQDLAHYKDLYLNFRDGFSKDSTSVNQRYEKIVQEKMQIEEELRETKEKYKRLAKKYSDKAQEIDESKTITFKPGQNLHNQKSLKSENNEKSLKGEYAQKSFNNENNGKSYKNGNSGKPVKSGNNPGNNRSEFSERSERSERFDRSDRNDRSDRYDRSDLSRSDDRSYSNERSGRYEDSDRNEDPDDYNMKRKPGARLREPGKQVNNPAQKDEKTPLKNPTPTKNTKESPYSTSNLKKEKRSNFVDNEYITNSRNTSESPQRRQIKSRTNISQSRRRSSEMTPGFGTSIKRNRSSNSPVRPSTHKPDLESKPCEICVRRHGEAYFRSSAH
jgi:hypothetical protein